MSCDSTYTVDDVTYECAGISCPISEWLGIEDRGHKAWAVDVEWKDSEADVNRGAATKSAGWGNPDRARKWHFFRAGESSSVCGRWTWGWPRSDLPFARRCKRCERAAKEDDR